MNQIKKLIKKQFTSLVFFYSFLGNKIFIAFGLSIAVSIMDGLGLSMFFPLLQVVSGDELNSGSADLGNLSYLVTGIENMGIPLHLVSVLLIMVVFFILKGIAAYFSSVYQVILKQSFMRKLRLDLINHLNKISFKKFILSDAGRIQNTLTGEVTLVSSAFTSYFGAFQQGIMLMVYIIFALLLDPQFAILVSLGGLCTHFLYNTIYKYTKRSSKQLTADNNLFQGQVLQHVSNFKYLKATGRVYPYSKRLNATINNIEHSRRKIGFLASISSAAREPLLIIIIAVVIFVQVKYFNGKMGAILISLLVFYRALTALVAVQLNWNAFLQTIGSMDNMMDFQSEMKANREKNGNTVLNSFQEKIELKDVGFHYDNTPILKNIDLTIHHNETFAFVGESGSGKTTIVNLIAGLLPEDNGAITVDNILLKDIKKETYQSRIGYVSQDPVIFNDTIYNNISFWAEPTTENIARFNKAIQQASLTKFLSELPEQEATELGNNGINLSGGQKQRISIARELFKEIDILILDEATSALDSETEREIQQSIESLQGQYTILIVAHRLSTIRNVNKVVLMEKGVIVDIDSFDNLVQKQERFRRMVELQEL
ncbi:MAG TPA: ABC transporter ATP-binding protein [Edaphocola sp.]|nr:ABC transporter ATP-binding protein [Edaphocola sp.]